MDTRRLYSFVRVVDAGSITRAADLLHIAQPALSQQMNALESLFGQQLLSRSKQGVEPTEAGRVLYRHAQVILRQLEQARAEVEVVGRELAGGVSVGLAPYSTVNALALPLLSAVRARYPRVLLHINENFGGILSESLMTGRMDMALLYDSGPIRGVDFERLLTEELVVVAPGNIDLPGDPDNPVSMTDLADVPLLLPGRTHTIRRVVDQAFAQTAIAANIVGEVESVSLMARAVRSGLGATVLPLSIAQRMIGGKDLRQRHLHPALEVQVSLGTASGQPLSRTAGAVRDLLREVLKAYVLRRAPLDEGESSLP